MRDDAEYDPVQNVLDRLKGAKSVGDDKWAARCPAHDDEHPSLGVSRGRDGRALLHCHVGCETKQIAAAIGLRMRDLFTREPRRILETYDYHDTTGAMVFQTVRYVPKDFSQRRPDGNGGWVWNLDGVPRVLYQLPELLAADPNEPVYVVEGEKDCDHLAALGLVATTNPQGAGKWKSLADDSALNGRRVVILQDRDDAGRKHAQDVAKRLTGKAAEVRIVAVPDWYHDVSEWIEARDALSAGELREQLRLAVDAAPTGDSGDVDLSNIVAPVAPKRDNEPELVVRRLSEVERAELAWLWPGRFPLGKLSLLCGDPGLGKSMTMIDAAARVSRGEPWPDNPLLTQPIGSVILFSAEDDLNDTIAPRLDRAGADSTNVYAVEGVQRCDPETGEVTRWYFSLEIDLPKLEKYLASVPNVRLVVIDPISAYCGKVDSHKNAEVRALLAPLAELAGRYHVAIVCVTHLSKGAGGKAVNRAMGSLAFTAAARAVWAVMKDQNDPQRRLFLPVKTNLAADPDGLAYRISNGRVEWEVGQIKMHADDALAAEAAALQPGRSHARQEATLWLRNKLATGPQPVSDLMEEAKQLGIAEKTLRRAFKDLGGRASKSSFDGGWHWALSGEVPDAA